MKVIFRAQDGTALIAEVNPSTNTFAVTIPVRVETLLEFNVEEDLDLTISGPLGQAGAAGVTVETVSRETP